MATQGVLNKMYKFDEAKELELAEPSVVENCECEDVLIEEIEEIKKLAQGMIRLCVDKGGLGLAAPQVGVMKKMFVWMNGSNSFQLVINPAFFPDKKITNTVEGCLTYPDKQFYTKRAKAGNARYEIPDPKDQTKFKKMFKKLSGERALVFQHEFDHLKGKTIATEGELMWDREDGKA